jgi:uncharacterized protein YcaQ
VATLKRLLTGRLNGARDRNRRRTVGGAWQDGGIMQTLSLAGARRIALAAQGFAGPRPVSAPTRRHLRRLLSNIQLIQLDSVNVAVRAHYMPAFSRLGPFEPALIDDAVWSHSARRPRMLVEYWAHEASLLPMNDWPLLQSGAKRPGWWANYARIIERTPSLAEDVLAVVKELGPIGAGGIEREIAGAAVRGPGAWWARSEVKKVCEWLFGMGQLTTGTRRSFERLVTRSAVALGVATESDLRDYYRLGPADSRRAVTELVEDGVLEPVQVLGWRAHAYRHVDARSPRAITGRALLCPFDPLIWERARTERLFDFRYRIEIYVPEPKRVHGYYVFPFLLDGELVARVDLKSDRAAGVLRVQGAFAEPGAEPGRVSAELAAELRTMAEWLGLEGVAVGERGDLAPFLRAQTV